MNIGGAGSYVYEAPVNDGPASVSTETEVKPEQKRPAPTRGPVKGKKLERRDKEKQCLMSSFGGVIKCIFTCN